MKMQNLSAAGCVSNSAAASQAKIDYGATGRRMPVAFGGYVFGIALRRH
jgi:hypothetical protein